MTGTPREAVVLIPGLWLLGSSLFWQARRLQAAGFAVHRISYPTVRHTLKENAIHLEQVVRKIDAKTIHFVGHSLGGIVIRALFHFFPDQRPGRIVTIASPHGGTHVGELFSQSKLGRLLLGASVPEVLAHRPAQWALPSREIGVIRGDLPVGLGRFFPGLTTPNDGLLTAEETWLEGATDEITLHVAHTGMLFAAAVAEATIHFLKHGRFGAGQPDDD